MNESPVFIVDAMNYIFRVFHGLPESIVSPKGMPTNAVLGYTRTLLRIIKERKPVYMAAAFETGGSFRTQMFEQYKANRTETPPSLIPQFDFGEAQLFPPGKIFFTFVRQMGLSKYAVDRL